ncbi:MAG: glycosyltransferase, partial [Chloroflexi bacterium]|nr:glycosyltransferase [Chloroflexota bacterium]
MALQPARVLILYSACGGGHSSVALAVEEGLRSLYGDGIAVQRVDPFSLDRRTTADRLVSLYPNLLIHRARVWRPIYYHSNRPRILRPLLSVARRLTADRMRGVVERARADVVVAVDPLTPQLVAPFLAHERTPLLLVVTDLVNVHRAWCCPRADEFLAPSRDAALALARLGVPADRITLSGLPVRLGFCRPADSAALRAAYGLDVDRPVVLVSGGGSGAGDLERAVLTLLRARLPAQIVAVCGRNRRLRLRLQSLPSEEPDLRVFGFVEQMADLLGAAEAVVTKAGSVTIAEAAAAGRPVVLFHEVPGQEDGNVDWVERNGLGFDGRTPDRLVAAVRHLLCCGTSSTSRSQPLNLPTSRQLPSLIAALAAPLLLGGLGGGEGTLTPGPSPATRERGDGEGTLTPGPSPATRERGDG